LTKPVAEGTIKPAGCARGKPSPERGGWEMRLAIWSTTTPRENSTHTEMFRRQLEEVEILVQRRRDRSAAVKLMRKFGSLSAAIVAAVPAGARDIAEAACCVGRGGHAHRKLAPRTGTPPR
jgi:hypothetical protein